MTSTQTKTETNKTELFNRYVMPNRKLIYCLCVRYSSHPSHVEENYCESLVNLYKYIESYKPEKSLATWLHICTKRFVNNLNEKHSKHYLYDLPDNYENIVDEPPTHVSIYNYKTECTDEFLTILENMNPVFKKALLLRMTGYTYKEIAKIEHINMNTTKGRIFHARDIIRKNLNKTF